MQQDTLSDAFSAINNASRTGKKHAVIDPANNLIQNVLMELQNEGYIGVFELVEDGKAGKFKVEIKPAINQCQSIKPRFYVKKDEYDKYAKRYLPARGFGYLIITTSKGVMTHQEAEEEEIGGQLLGYVY
jgi:small subunit ribosomal protein S8